ncbi:hypothetical protein ABLO27_15175 [Roseibium sp. SCPC15]|jgi:hypothetical protein|uniref:hypothetical protein n=1 Tax=Roseibium sp. SCP15 TaxID=3141376 RepID=UPI0033399F66
MISRSFAKTVLLVLICGLLAACQTTGLKPGSVETRFPVDGWIKAQKGNSTIYACVKCKTPQIILTGPSKVTGDVESAIRADVLSTGLLSEIDKTVTKLSSGAIRSLSRRKITTKNYSGFEFVYRIQEPGKKPIYLAGRSIVQNDKGMQISSYAASANVAKANLRKYLANTTIRRLP